MTKLNFNNSVFVVKVYETTNPSIVESFPATEDGLNDANMMWLCLPHQSNYF